MNTPAHIAQHLRQVYFGGNWTCSNVKDTLAGVTWQQAGTPVHTFNSILTLVYHMGYYVSAINRALQGQALNSSDAESFKHPPLHSADDWENLLRAQWAEVETCATLIARLPEERLNEVFVEEKYGTYYRNLHGLIEHTHYHLGQIALLKKWLPQ